MKIQNKTNYKMVSFILVGVIIITIIAMVFEQNSSKQTEINILKLEKQQNDFQEKYTVQEALNYRIKENARNPPRSPYESALTVLCGGIGMGVLLGGLLGFTRHYHND